MHVRDGYTIVVGAIPVCLSGLHASELDDVAVALVGAGLGRLSAFQRGRCAPLDGPPAATPLPSYCIRR
jgi:hypothetical protein